jgi:hypothetical protein
MKERLGLPKAVVVLAEAELHEPLRPGDRVVAEQVLDSVEPPTENRLGPGRYWSISVHYRRARDGVLPGIEMFRFYGYRPRT